MISRLLRHGLWLLLGIVLLAAIPGAHASYTYLYKDFLILEDGKTLAGTYDVRLSLWDTPVPAAEDNIEESGVSVLNVMSPNYSGYTEEHMVMSATNGGFSITMGTAVPITTPLEGTVYLQVDVKPSGTDQRAWRRIKQSNVATGERRPILLSELQETRVRFEHANGSYEGILLTKDGKPEKGTYMARFSLWRSDNLDRSSDMLTDGTIRSSTSNYLGYSTEIRFSTDEEGRFFIPTNMLIPPLLMRRQANYVQIDMRRSTESVSAYDMIDPDMDVLSSVDRFLFQDGKLITPEDNNVSTLRDGERLLVSNIPGGTTSRSFELGVNNDMPLGYYEIRARYTKGKVAVLRFNAVTQTWEVSSDGIVFSPLAGFLEGTPSESFTIGLGKDKGPFTLQFGDGLSGAKITYDPIRGAFSFNKNVDFQQNQLLNAVLENRPTPPENPVAGQQYFDTVQHQAFFYNGSRWIGMGAALSSSNNNPQQTTTPTFIPGGGGGTTVVQNITNVTGGGAGDWDDLPLRPKMSIFGTDANMSIMTPASVGKGSLSEDFDPLSNRTFYRWETKQTSMQTMQMVMQWVVPEDFDSMQSIPVQFVFRTADISNLLNTINLTMSVNGTLVPMTGAANLVSDIAGEWKVVTPTMTPATIVPGDVVTFTVDLNTTNNASVDIWALMVNYMGR